MTENFSGDVATHSLRKGGARFYSAGDAPEQATMLQGGWRTTDTMRAIYTSMSQAEVCTAIHEAANKGGARVDLKILARELNVSRQELATVNENRLKSFLSAVSNNIDVTPWKTFAEWRVGIIMRHLSCHPNERVQTRAAEVLSVMRSRFAAHKADARRKQD